MKRAKRFATGLLILASIVFVIAHLLIRDIDGDTFNETTREGSLSGWAVVLPYVRATAEAAMVGALADWFAVTALFRHPLGLPIPHTAIIKRRKDQIGASLGRFVRENFMTQEVVAGRLAEADLANALGNWLQQPENSEKISKQTGAVISGLLEVLDDEKIQEVLEDSLRKRMDNVSAADVSGRVLDAALEANYHQRLFESILGALNTFLDDNAEVFRQKFADESPWWIPELVDDRVYGKVYGAVKHFIAEIVDEPNHKLRSDYDSRMRTLRESLQSSPAAIAKAEEWKQLIVEHPELNKVIDGAWRSTKRALISNVESEESTLSQSISKSVQSFGEKLTQDEELQARVNEWIISAAGYVAAECAEPVADVISATVATWDPDETAERLEAEVGRDLQFIRINGTIVGGLAGLIIYSLSQLG